MASRAKLVSPLFDMDSLGFVPSLLEYFPSHAGGMAKAPNWWYRAFKTRQLWDGALTSDNIRSEMAFGIANLLRTGPERRELTAELEDSTTSSSPSRRPSTSTR